MKEKEKNELYNQPTENDTTNGRHDRKMGDKAEHRLAANPNPGANENIKHRDIDTDENDGASQAGSEITDGEDG